MNFDRIEGNWRQFKGNLKQHWGKLTNDQFIAMEGKREQLSGANQESYGRSRDAAMKQHAAWKGYRKEK